jgi:hypothetical protein
LATSGKTVTYVVSVKLCREWPSCAEIAEAVGEAGFEFGEPVEAFAGGVRHAGDHGGHDLVFPAGDRRGERGQFADLLVLRAPVVEGVQPVADLPLARRGSGNAGAEPERVAEFFLGDPGQGDLLPFRAGIQDIDYLAGIVR